MNLLPSGRTQHLAPPLFGRGLHGTTKGASDLEKSAHPDRTAAMTNHQKYAGRLRPQNKAGILAGYLFAAKQHIRRSHRMLQLQKSKCADSLSTTTPSTTESERALENLN
jgi:hypothetical protein